jgi:hypothetical protein
MSSIPFSIKMHDKQHVKTYEDVFCVESSTDFVGTLKQIINIVEKYKLSISANNLHLVVVGGDNKNEEVILIERVT